MILYANTGIDKMNANNRRRPGKTGKIALFNVNWLGDVLFSTAVIANLSRIFPESGISCILPPRCFPVLQGNPHVERLIAFDEKGAQFGIAGKMRFLKELSSAGFDSVFLLHRSFSRALLCRFSGIPRRIGYYTAKRGFLLTCAPQALDPLKVHRIDYYLGVLEGAGFPVSVRDPELFILPEEERAAGLFFEENGVKPGELMVGINPGGNWMPKRWPVEYWKLLAGMLAREAGCRIVITGGERDIPLAREIASGVRAGLPPVIACGRSGIRQFAAVSLKLDLFISADSGPLHIANCAGGKGRIIALFGPTDPLLTGPRPARRTEIIRGECGCRIPCYETDCVDNRCMKNIEPQQVLLKAMEILNRVQR
ncbi:MAG: lipopolysaccharide heptosyltransferase II [Candidatus Omnitrophota bacterium]